MQSIIVLPMYALFFLLLLGCEKQELRYPDNIVDYTPSAEELAEIEAIIEAE
jgi:hypothetical protein